ncbi:hypothetical protein FPOAC2_01483 [Fusarium poae]|uniref:Uncharacterized protein n=1 Tax=Fusarium poae TaxID=36050 RepID=A0A1B8B3W0_FUSPO|nr:hypothetical protein FPOAC1_001410 [Fusarium poae]KAG8675431.1 hypothetical protein FPOAC1_001410 [Fusarium poae]OBS27411.1 hypothetical protein FPOA_01353 [Fusarium poae]
MRRTRLHDGPKAPWLTWAKLCLSSLNGDSCTLFYQFQRQEEEQDPSTVPSIRLDSPHLTLPHLASFRLASPRLDSTEQVPTVTVKARSSTITVGLFSAAPQISLVQVDFGLLGFRAVCSTPLHSLHPRLAQRQLEILFAVEPSVMSPSLAGL